MNARQKAKYWKMKYQELANLPIRPTIVVSDRKCETLSYTKVIDDEVRIRQILDNEGIQKRMLAEVMDQLAERAKSYVDITVERGPLNCSMRINGRLGVVIPFYDHHDIYNTHWDVMHDKRENNGGTQ